MFGGKIWVGWSQKELPHRRRACKNIARHRHPGAQRRTETPEPPRWRNALHRSRSDSFMVGSAIRALCGCSSMVERQPSKLHTRVRFPLPAPLLFAPPASSLASCAVPPLRLRRLLAVLPSLRTCFYRSLRRCKIRRSKNLALA